MRCTPRGTESGATSGAATSANPQSRPTLSSGRRGNTATRATVQKNGSSKGGNIKDATIECQSTTRIGATLLIQPHVQNTRKPPSHLDNGGESAVRKAVPSSLEVRKLNRPLRQVHQTDQKGQTVRCCWRQNPNMPVLLSKLRRKYCHLLPLEALPRQTWQRLNPRLLLLYFIHLNRLNRKTFNTQSIRCPNHRDEGSHGCVCFCARNLPKEVLDSCTTLNSKFCAFERPHFNLSFSHVCGQSLHVFVKMWLAF